VSEEDSVVSRRQFFRGLTGDLLRTIGEVSGLDRLEEHFQEQTVITDIEGYVSAERQTAAMNDIFGFLEQLGGQDEEHAVDEAAAELYPDVAPEPALEHSPEPEPVPDPHAAG
jgi:hypothetical protein